MDKGKVYDRKIEQIIKAEKVLSILLIGAGANIEKSSFNTLRDIDLFVITDENYEFQREVAESEGVLFDISYMSLKSFEKGIDEKLSFLINSLQKCRIVYNINKSLQEFLEKIKSLHEIGPPKLENDEVNYIRYKLYQDYEDILSRKDDVLNVSFLINNLFYNILASYFKLNGYWMPKDKKILNNIEKIDNTLYILCKDFIQEDYNSKLEKLDEILNYVLKPYGGTIKFWKRKKFPLI
ncbi:hypothetical protein R9X47_23305 [Wukongibacter baidiensis]|uniref:hypothetical protein n=1 Tax=Wukongibacter baidiensis TaxID=1723361 RepID=UPI003D7FDD06